MNRDSALGVAAVVGLAIGVGVAVFAPRSSAPSAAAPSVDAGEAPIFAAAIPVVEPAGAAVAPAVAPAVAQPSEPRVAELVAPAPPPGARSGGGGSSSGSGISIHSTSFATTERSQRYFATLQPTDCAVHTFSWPNGSATYLCGRGSAYWSARVTDRGGEISLARFTDNLPSNVDGKKRMCPAGMRFLQLPRGASWNSAGASNEDASCDGRIASDPQRATRAFADTVFASSDAVEHLSWRNDGIITNIAIGWRAPAVWFVSVSGREGAPVSAFHVERWQPDAQPEQGEPFFIDEKAAFIQRTCPQAACARALPSAGVARTASGPDVNELIDRCVYACRGEPDAAATLAPMDVDALRAALRTPN